MTPPASDHFNGKTFYNPGEWPDRGWIDLLKWRLTARTVPWPARVEVERRPLPPPPEGDGVVATWIGQSTVLLRAAGATILTDPIFSERASPVAWAGPRRAAPPALALADVPRVDVVLVSHDHFDHCDLPSLRALARRDDPLAVAPLRHGPLLAGAGFRRVAELDWWEGRACPGGAGVTLVPALHWCRRRPFATNYRLWGGFMVRLGGRLVYFAGDSGYREGFFSEIGRRCGRPDLALLPIGAYEPQWFMGPAHMNPAEAVRAHQEVGARRTLGIHWGTFQLTDEGRDEPPRALEEARAAAGLGAEAIAALPLGSSVAV